MLNKSINVRVFFPCLMVLAMIAFVWPPSPCQAQDDDMEEGRVIGVLEDLYYDTANSSTATYDTANSSTATYDTANSITAISDTPTYAIKTYDTANINPEDYFDHVGILNLIESSRVIIGDKNLKIAYGVSVTSVSLFDLVAAKLNEASEVEVLETISSEPN